jgi:hypothetical protein
MQTRLDVKVGLNSPSIAKWTSSSSINLLNSTPIARVHPPSHPHQLVVGHARSLGITLRIVDVFDLITSLWE